MNACPNGWKAPSVGYQNGCRCERCSAWKREIGRRERERIFGDTPIVRQSMTPKPKRLPTLKPIGRRPPWTPETATSDYRDALDSIDLRSLR